MSSTIGSFPTFEQDQVEERRALRALQIANDLIPSSVYSDNPRARRMIAELQSQLGKNLRLECSGVYEGGGVFSHDDGTCPIHEWLVPEDAVRPTLKVASG